MNANEFVQKCLWVIESHREDTGAYRRWNWQNENGERNLGVSEYGCADAANMLYTFGRFVREPDARAAWVRVLRGMQNPHTGLFSEPTHHTIHTTAHCLAALELFDAPPLCPPRALFQYLNAQTLVSFLDSLDWDNSPWNNSHQGAGLYAALAVTGGTNAAWQREYFGYLKTRADPETGLGLAGRRGSAPLCHQLYGWFHYLFNHEYARMPMPYPEKVIDSCISLYKENRLTPRFNREVGFMEIDWVFALNRATRQTPHRFWEAKDLLKRMAQTFVPWLSSLDEKTDDGMNDLHMLFGAVCAVAELQAALPGEIETDTPLKLVLDRRPFI